MPITPVSFRLDSDTRDLLTRLQSRYAAADGSPLPAVRVLRLALGSLEEHGPPSRLTAGQKKRKKSGA